MEGAKTYPVAEVQGDPRLCMGLLDDVCQVLEDHGFPPVRHGLDLMDLLMALHRFLYGASEREAAV